MKPIKLETTDYASKRDVVNGLTALLERANQGEFTGYAFIATCSGKTSHVQHFEGYERVKLVGALDIAKHTVIKMILDGSK